jgi:hypothetical protein
MKILSQVLIMMCLMVAAGCSNKKTVTPAPAVLTSFESLFGKNTRVSWEVTDRKTYLASFTHDGHPAKSYFDESGKWLKTETELISSELPPVIVKTVVGAYNGSTIFKSFQVEDPESGTIYRLTLKRGRQVTDIRLSAGGVMLDTPMLR